MGATDPDPYALLEVAQDADAAEIKRAYRRLARAWHPDRNRAPDAAERFKQIARAWEILGDPVRRRVHDGHTSAARDGIVPPEHVDAVADAIERAQRWIEEVVVPHYASLHRGAGAEMAARWVRDLPTLDTALKPAITRRGRRLARRWLARALVRFEHGYQATTLLRAVRGFVIGVSPLALWEAGFRGPLGGDVVELDNAVLRLLLARYAQALCTAGFDGPDADTDEGWTRALDRARARDSAIVWSERFWRGVWTGVALLLAFMLGSAWIGW